MYQTPGLPGVFLLLQRGTKAIWKRSERGSSEAGSYWP